MAIGITLIFCNLLYIILLAAAYFSKKRVSNIETKIYNKLLIVDILGLFLELVCCLTVSKIIDVELLRDIVNRLFLVFIVTWVFLFSKYTIYVSFNNKSKFSLRIKNNYNLYSYVFLSCYIIFIMIILMLPLNYYFDGTYVYSYGLAANLDFVAVGFFVAITLLCVLLNIKKAPRKKILPMFVFLFLIVFAMVFRVFYPGILLINATTTFVTVLMYFTIENPDVRMIEQLNIARDHAEKANRAKTDFLSSMSHEIRTPLNAIVGFSEMIQTEDDMDEIKSEAKDIVMASHTLLEIVNGILDISKIEANKMEIVNKEYELLPELENLSKLMIPRIGEKPLELRCKFAEDIPHVLYGDIAKIKEVITNILTNAVKYTEEGHIDFEVNCINQKEQSSLVIKVADTGRGIKKDQIDKLFTKFQRLDEDKNTTIEGTGLGLAITKSLVEMMGGKIIVNSEYGKGSTFTIYLKQKIVKLHKESDKKEYDDRDDYDFTGYTILVVDDNQLNLKVATKLLNRYNITVETASDGFECIDKIKAGNKYDLVLLDDMMPRMKGTETLTRLKQDPNYSIPTIALTANAITGMKEQYMSMGFNDYLGKPIEKMELLRVLSKYLKPKVNNTVKEEKIEVKEEPIEKIEIDEKPTNNKKILVVDDNQINIKIASKMLEKYNYDIDTASSGQESIEKVKNTKYDLIFMDHMMPGMDGIETLKELKKIEGFNTPVIALTADAIVGSKEKFLEAGFDDYISKPIDRNYLDELIKKILG